MTEPTVKSRRQYVKRCSNPIFCAKRLAKAEKRANIKRGRLVKIPRELTSTPSP